MEEIVYDTNQLINYLKTSKTSFKVLTTIFNIIIQSPKPTKHTQLLFH